MLRPIRHSWTLATETALELALLGVFLAVWIVALASLVGLLPAAGLLNLGLFQLYGTAAFLGWVAGNVYVQRSRRVPKPLRSRFLLIYLLGPPGLLYLLRSLAAPTVQASAPLAAVYASGVFFVLFMVPVTFRSSFSRRNLDR